MVVNLMGLMDNVCKIVIDELNVCLVDVVVLFVVIKQVYWNVKGFNFIVVYEFFDQVFVNFQVYVDEIVECVQQLDGVVIGMVEKVVKVSLFKEYLIDLIKVEDYIKVICEWMCDYGVKVCEVIDIIDEVGDVDMVDLLMGVLCIVDKDLWFLESYLE